MARDVRTDILDGVEALLAGGHEDFTYERLAGAARVSRQTLYSHFPDRATLLVAVADRRRTQLDADGLSAPILSAPTARDALRALLAFHAAFTPQVMSVSRAVEVERARHPEIDDAFDRRAAGRRQFVRHVMTRLHAEGDLDPIWTVDTATDLVTSMTSAWVTAELIGSRAWTPTELHDRLLHTLESALLVHRTTTTRKEPS